MSAIYEISGPKNDFDSAVTETRGRLTIPAFLCPDCGNKHSCPPVWYASLSAANGKASSLLNQVLPGFISHTEYLDLVSAMRTAFQSNASFPSGSICGMLSLKIQAENGKGVGSLTMAKLLKNPDWIQAGLFHWLISQRVVDRLQSVTSPLKLTPVEFESLEPVPGRYHVIELDPVPVWTSEEHARWDLRICKTCYAVDKRVRGGSYSMKRFDPELFGPGPAIYRGIEQNGVYINQPLFDALSALENKGCSFKKVGDH